MEWPLERFVGTELLRSGRCLLLPHLPRFQADVVNLLLKQTSTGTLFLPWMGGLVLTSVRQLPAVVIKYPSSPYKKKDV